MADRSFYKIVRTLMAAFPNGGYFVEAGAHNGVGDSHTYDLENLGWKGLCVEPSNAFGGLQTYRSCEIDNRCLWSESGEVEFREIEGDHIELSGITSKFQSGDGWDRISLPGSVSKKKAVSLATMLEEYGAPQSIEFLCLDTEGSELQILEAHDFDKFSFSIVFVEYNHVTSRRDELIEFLSTKGYQVFDEDGLNVHMCLERVWDRVSDARLKLGENMATNLEKWSLSQWKTRHSHDNYFTSEERRASASPYRSLDEVCQMSKDDDILELGCGYGKWLGHYSQFVRSASGLDLHWNLVEGANRFLGSKSVRLGDGVTIPWLGDGRFSLVYAIAVFYHIPRSFAGRYVRESLRVLRAGGRIAFQFYNKGEGKYDDLSIGHSGELAVGWSKDELEYLANDCGLRKVSVIEYSDCIWLLGGN